MSNTITKDMLMQVLPAPLANDEGMMNLGETAAMFLTALWQKVSIPIIYPNIDNLPEALLDILAKDFNVYWYEYYYDIRAKRALIKDAVFVHKHMGTVAAVEKALSAVWPASSIDEWFRYGGEPFHFRVNLYGRWLSDNDDEIIKSINKAKNVRSVLDGITVHLPDAKGRVQIYTGLAMCCFQSQHFNADEAPDFDAENLLADGLGNILCDGLGVVLTC